MKLLDTYFISLSDICQPFANNEVLYNQARIFYQQLDNLSFLFLVIAILLSVFSAWFYFGPYNNKAGRHYRISHWVIFLLIAFVSVFLVTWALQEFSISISIRGVWIYELQIALINACYATIIYLAATFVVHNWLPTNAYRFFKF